MRDPTEALDSYRRLSQEVYDITKPVPEPDFVGEYYLRQAQRTGGPILEPMCGSGRHLIPLLERGFDIDGVDASPHMLRACRQRCAEKGLSPTLYQQFLSEMVLPRRYALVFIPAGSIVLVAEEQAQEASLQRIYDAMLPGAKLLIEVDTPPATPPILGEWRGYWVERSDGAKIVVSSFDQSYNERTHLEQSLIKYELVVEGSVVETEVETMRYHFHTASEFAERLAQAGFTWVRALKAWGEYAEREPDEGDPRVLLECYRPQ